MIGAEPCRVNGSHYCWFLLLPGDTVNTSFNDKVCAQGKQSQYCDQGTDSYHQETVGLCFQNVNSKNYIGYADNLVWYLLMEIW